MGMNVIGLEVSTSSAKCILFSLEEGMIDSVSIPFAKDTSDIVTQDADRMVEAAIQALMDMVKRNNRKVEAIGLSGTWHSMLLLDREREPLGRIQTWADLSAASTVAEIITDQELVNRFYHQTGCVIHPLYPAWKYHHLSQTKPEYLKNVAYISSQIEYLFEKLTGEQKVSRCTASGTGLFNIHTLNWDRELLDFVGVKPEQLSELAELSEVAPLKSEIASIVGLPMGIPVTVGGADGALNQVANGGTRKGVMSFSVGTSGALRMVSSEPKVTAKPSTWCYYLSNEKRIIGAAVHACNNLNWFLDSIQEGESGQREYDRKAETGVDPLTAPYFMPFIYGERSPGWMGQRRGGFLEVNSNHHGAHLYYAILEGILFNLFQCYQLITQLNGEPRELIISGGIMNSPFWLQMAADIFGKELLATGYTNDSTVGGGLVALQAVGGIAQLEDYHPTVTGQVFPRSEYQGNLRTRYNKYLSYYKSGLND